RPRPTTKDKRPMIGNQIDNLVFVFRLSSFVFRLAIGFWPAAGIERLRDRHLCEPQRAAALYAQIRLAVVADHLGADHSHIFLEPQPLPTDRAGCEYRCHVLPPVICRVGVGVWGRQSRSQIRFSGRRTGGKAASTTTRKGIRKGCALPYCP